MFTLEPQPDGGIRPQTALLAARARPSAPNDWVAPGSAFDLDLAGARVSGAADMGDLISVSRSSAGLAAGRDGQFVSFSDDVARLTDKGLLIEERRTNLLESPFELGSSPWRIDGGTGFPAATELQPFRDVQGRVLTLRESDGEGWCLVAQEAAFENGSHTFSTFALHNDRRFLVLRGDRPSSASASFDIEAGQAGAAAADGVFMSGPRSEWHRVGVSWRTREAGSGQVIVALRDKDGNAAPYPRSGARVHLWGAVLEQGRFPTSPLVGTREQDGVRGRGVVEQGLGARAFTLVLETRDLPAVPVVCEILSSNGRALLRRAEDGALASEFGSGLRTRGQPLEGWGRRRRCAISIDRDAGTLAVAVTGAGAARATGDLPPIGPVLIGALGAGALNGTLVRLTGYAKAFDPPTLSALVA
jgi:hypothetical protein